MIERSSYSFLLTSNNFQQMDRRPGGQPFHTSFGVPVFGRGRGRCELVIKRKRRETGDRLLTHTHTCRLTTGSRKEPLEFSIARAVHADRIDVVDTVESRRIFIRCC